MSDNKATPWLEILVITGLITFVGIKATQAGPEALAAAAGRVVAAFDQARVGR